jgi:S-adenosylmethionine decarboxylase
MNKTGSVTVTGFEGPEKRLEVDFKKNLDRPNGLRSYTKDQWQEMLNFSACTIIGQTSNEEFDSYVLSESSLFVYPYKLMIKTCGTTTLLKIIPTLLEYAKNCDLEVELVMYSRKNFLFPSVQPFPHTDWSVELSYLDNYFDGNSYILGPLTNDHWYLYLADYSDSTTDTTKEQTLEIMMHNLERNNAFNFYRKEGTEDRDKFPGVAELIPGQITDEFNFTPCGYSMNGLRENVYSTIHVTPEPHCSYASFETNLVLPCYKSLISNVFDLFKPGTVTLTLFSEKASAVSQERSSSLEIPGYVLAYKTVSELGNNRDVTLCSYESVEFHNAKQQQRRVRTLHPQPLDIMM